MAESFQKTVKARAELWPQHPGILEPQRFSEYFELHCYQPSPTLQPFVMYIWTQRPRKPLPDSRQLIEVPSGPSAYLLLAGDEGYIQGAGGTSFYYNPGETIAGAKFRPGGLHAFCPDEAAELAGKRQSIDTLMPGLLEVPLTQLLCQPDNSIVDVIEEHLVRKQPVYDKNIDLLHRIVDTISDNPAQTVEAFARQYGMSERSLQLLFHKYVGVGVKWVIMRSRLLKAMQLAMATTPRPTWTDIALRQGYSSHPHFTREFKELVGITPSQYIARLSG